jgi:signal transduction histidine kinase
MKDIGGECRFESQPGRGTKVILRLPWPKEDSNVHSIA